ncbi:GNAT family N-acetyltransferase [Devosia sp. A449]
MDIVVARTVTAVESLRPLWASLSVPNIDADIDYFLTVVQAFPAPVAPYVIHIQADGHDMLVVARTEDLHLPFKFGYLTVGHIRQRALIVAFDGILGSRGRADEEHALFAIRAALARGDADLVVMRNLDIAGQRLAAAKAVSHWLFRNHGKIPTHRRGIDVSDSFSAFLAKHSASTRKMLRREERNLMKHFNGDVRLRRFERPDELEEACTHMAAVAELTYQHNLGAAFSASVLDRALLRIGFAKGWARIWMLYCAGRPVAFWSGTIYAGTCALGTPGYDPAFARYAVGRLAMLRMIEDLCRDPAVVLMDFGQGEAEYKSRFGQLLRNECDVMIAAPRLWPLLVLWMHSLFTLANEIARRFAASIGWLGHLKTMWRKRGSVVVVDAEVAP